VRKESIMKTRDIVVGGLLAAIAILIPLLFANTPLMVHIPPFSATIASHVPILLSMAISPAVAIFTGVVSGIGFTIRTSPIIGVRALMHAVFGGLGAYAYKRKMPFYLVLLLMAPIHGLLEALVVLPFGFNLYQAFVATGIGTVLHHLVDAAITMVIYQALIKLSFLKKSY
jgi:niacin transporter